jgi:hypothetical protein
LRDAQDQINRLKHAGETVVSLRDILVFDPGADRQEHGAKAADVMQAVLRIVLGHKDHRIFPAGAVRDQLDRQPKRRVVVLDKARERAFRSVRKDVIGAAIVVRVIRINLRRQLASIGVFVFVLRFEYLLEAVKAAVACWIFRSLSRVRLVSVI